MYLYECFFEYMRKLGDNVERGAIGEHQPHFCYAVRRAYSRDQYNMLHGIIIATYGEVHFLLLFIKQFLNSLHQKVQFKLFSDKCTIKLQSNKV